MFDRLLMVPLPIIDGFFSGWNITPDMSKVVLLFAGMGSYLLVRVTDSAKIVLIPVCLVFLIFATVIVNIYVQDALGSGLTPFVKMLISASIGQTMAACMLMAIFKTGEIRRSN